ncbi:MAG TPA: ABC transporter permease subunit [Candidatus Limnocylindria bacterium]|nr:ABC transporter permease subunit [Candidatus Limnocylindria bacterium]
MTAGATVGRRQARVPPWRDVRVLRVGGQVLAVAAVAAALAWLGGNLTSAMSERGLGFGFGFLDARAGFAIPDSPVPYEPNDTYLQAYLVGLLNTLFVGILGIVLATVLGVLVAIARLSGNWLLNRTTGAYIEVMRNTPLLVQLFFLYFAVLLQLPPVRQSIQLPGSVYLNQRGLFLPAPEPSGSFAPWLGLVAAALAVAVAGRFWSARRAEAGHASPRFGRIGLAVAVAVALLGWFVFGSAPLTFEAPELRRFNFVGGMTMSTSFTAILVGLVIYTAAFIGEVVRGGIQAVRRGQVEAAQALGLSEGDTLRLVVFPQAMRIIVPPLTSQYLNLVKNSSLAIAVGYPDLFKVGVTMSNQTGQPVPVVVLVMGTYLAISLLTSLLMNAYNRRIQVLER